MLLKNRKRVKLYTFLFLYTQRAHNDHKFRGNFKSRANEAKWKICKQRYDFLINKNIKRYFKGKMLVWKANICKSQIQIISCWLECHVIRNARLLLLLNVFASITVFAGDYNRTKNWLFIQGRIFTFFSLFFGFNDQLVLHLISLGWVENVQTTFLRYSKHFQLICLYHSQL